MSDGAMALPAKENALFKQVVRCYEAKTWKKGIKTAVFDRGGFVYHGRVKAVAEACREAGVEF